MSIIFNNSYFNYLFSQTFITRDYSSLYLDISGSYSYACLNQLLRTYSFFDC
ncbi:hypothetical protein F961_03543 [Acinetobacter baumannii NIPH 60]|nr:hypothetical protein F961_03543 [Acinetobacter baumannii NIPH 60]